MTLTRVSRDIDLVCVCMLLYAAAAMLNSTHNRLCTVTVTVAVVRIPSGVMRSIVCVLLPLRRTTYVRPVRAGYYYYSDA